MVIMAMGVERPHQPDELLASGKPLTQGMNLSASQIGSGTASVDIAEKYPSTPDKAISNQKKGRPGNARVFPFTPDTQLGGQKTYR